MCRYAFHTYKSHFACFSCRKAFKKTALDDYVEHVGLKFQYQKIIEASSSLQNRKKIEMELGISYEEIKSRYLNDVSVCPQCGGQMAAMGLDFRPTSSKDVDAWNIISILYENGFAFKGCGCGGGLTPPKKQSEINEWLNMHVRKSEGEILLNSILQRKN